MARTEYENAKIKREPCDDCGALSGEPCRSIKPGERTMWREIKHYHTARLQRAFPTRYATTRGVK